MKRIFLLACCFVLLSIQPAWATKGHFTPGTSGIRAATLPPPGTYVKIYNTFLDAGEMRDNSGDKIIDSETDAYILTGRFIHVFDNKVLNADPIMDISVPFNYISNGRSNNNTFSLGDTMIQGLLSWHGPRWDAVMGPSVYLPIGSTSTGGAGKGYWSFIFGGGPTFYLDEERSWSLAFLTRVEGHAKDTAKRTPGMALHLESGLGKRISPNVTLGGVFTAYKQITNDHGEKGASLFEKDDKYQAIAFGPEIQLLTPSGINIEFRYLWEAEVKNGTQGKLFFLNFFKQF